MKQVKLVLREVAAADGYSKHPQTLQVGDVIQFERMPEFGTWSEGESDIAGFDYTFGTPGINLRTGEQRNWCFHAVKFDKVFRTYKFAGA